MKTQLSVILVFFSLYAATNSAWAQSWMMQSNAPSASWSCIASSADGNKLVAVNDNMYFDGDNYVFDGSIYTSTNSGGGWAQATNAPSAGWISCTSSADGNSLVALIAGGPIYRSTDSGTTWTVINTPSSFLNCITSSADGTKLAAGDWNDFVPEPSLIYTSTNSGVTWITNDVPSEYWTSIATSADGTKFVAACVNPDGTGTVFVSHDSGTTWNATDLPFTNWQAVASSADGCELVAAVSGGLVYTSTNAGATWKTNNVPVTSWISVACSADGTKFVAVNTYGLLNDQGIICTSCDSGASWISNDVPNDVSWQAIASSADGNRLAVATFNNSIYTFYSTPLPQLNLTPLSSHLTLSWLVPSTNFALQQNRDLNPTNWVTLTNAPTLNLTNLKYEIIVSPSYSSDFYRLVTP